MNATVRDVMTTRVVAVRLKSATFEGVVAVRDRLTYPPEPRSVPRTDMDLDF